MHFDLRSNGNNAISDSPAVTARPKSNIGWPIGFIVLCLMMIRHAPHPRKVVPPEKGTIQVTVTAAIDWGPEKRLPSR